MRILYIDIDSLRPDHLGCYGYHRPVSPHIDALARDAVRFERAYTPDAPCLPSRTALYTGRYGIQTGVVGHGGTAAQPKIEGLNRDFQDAFDQHGLAGRLQKLGLHTAMISPFGQRHSAHWFYAGFNEIHNTGMKGSESAEHVMPVVEDWMNKNLQKENWFLHVNFWDPHTPYRAPAELGEPFKNDPLPAWLQDPAVLERHKKLPGPHTAADFWMYDGTYRAQFPRTPGSIETLDDLHKVIDGYDTGVWYADAQVGRIVARLKAAGLYDETAIIVSADHGENFGELGLYGEHGTADDATCRIPMIIKWPGARPAVLRERFVYNIDLAPTLMDLLGGQKTDLWDGVSFADALVRGEDAGRDEVVLSQCAHVCQRSVRWDRWLYVRTYHCGFHLWNDEMLFDLQDDPHEQCDLAPARADLVREGAWRLARWHAAQMRTMATRAVNVEDPLWKVMQEGGPQHARFARVGQPASYGGVEKYLRRLEETGRGDAARRLAEKYADLKAHRLAQGFIE